MKIKTTILLRADVSHYVGRSGCTYDKEHTDKVLREYMAAPGSKYGVLFDDPDKLDTAVNLSDVSHKVTDIEITEDHVSVEVEILPTMPYGQVVEALAGTDCYLAVVPYWTSEGKDEEVAGRPGATYRVDVIDQILSFNLRVYHSNNAIWCLTNNKSMNYGLER